MNMWQCTRMLGALNHVIMFVENGSLMVMKYQGVSVITDEHIDNFQRFNPDIEPLNAMPLDQAAEIIIRHAA